MLHTARTLAIILGVGMSCAVFAQEFRIMNPIASPAINRNFDETQVVPTLEAQLFAQQTSA